MDEPLDEAYFTWLYASVWSVRRKDPNKTYWSLLKQLFQTEFIWLVPNDDNRIEDGKNLRYDFLADTRIEVPQEWMDMECSFLEMLIGLSRRLAFEADGEPRGWFWHLLENLEIVDNTDANYNERQVKKIVDDVIWRMYRSNGRGGLFPLDHPYEDQRDVELWYQLQQYLLERE